MKTKHFLFCILGLVLVACKPAEIATEPTKPKEIPVTTVKTEKPKTKKEPGWAPKVYAYNPSRTRLHDLIKTKLEVSFDWPKAYLYGKATLDLKSYFYPTNTVELDAKGMEIKRVALLKDGNLTDLKYAYDSLILSITLDKTYTREEEFQLYIDYVAKPNELENVGSAAIAGDKGLYFINPDGSEADKPQQIWTQGETMANSCWFPTIDAPNERTLQEMYITVQEKFKTLSNGKLVDSQQNSDGTRTDHWIQTIPHAPYLFMMCIGEFSKITDEWRGIEVSYYVEKEYEPYAREIFGNTPEMLEFFSNKLGYDYPWEKYAQVVVRDFVSGAMENTSAVIHGGFLQQTSRELLDGTNEDVISHELFHHWFGDLLTCESWANLPLNEGFATYGEYLWREYKYGKDEADKHIHTDLTNYLAEATIKREPLIRYHHKQRDEMFDAHSYQKGGRVLHMLRHTVGDDAFFASLKHYLNKNAFSDVEIDELRMSFEETTGQDLHWFFNQWYHNPGHPELKVKYEYADRQVMVEVEQTQNLDYMPVYRMPVEIDIVVNGKHNLHSIEVTQRKETFTLPSTTVPDYVVFDAEKVLLAKIREKKSKTEWVDQLKNGQNYIQKFEALSDLAFDAENFSVANAMLGATEDPFWAVRKNAITNLGIHSGSLVPKIIDRAQVMATEDPKSDVRKAALIVLGESDVVRNLEHSDLTKRTQAEKQYKVNKEVMVKALNDSSYAVASTALKYLADWDSDMALARVKEMDPGDNETLISTIAKLYMDADSPEAYDFVSQNIFKMGGGLGKFSLITDFSNYVDKQEGANRTQGVNLMKQLASDEPVWWIRLAAARSLFNFIKEPGMKGFIQQRAQDESNETIKTMYREQLEIYN